MTLCTAQCACPAPPSCTLAMPYATTFLRSRGKVSSQSKAMFTWNSSKVTSMEKHQEIPAGSMATQQCALCVRRENQHYPNVSVVIPALNEARNLRHVLPLIPGFVDEIILVDGYSTDDTVTLVEHLRPT